MMVIMTKQFDCSFIKPQDTSPEKKFKSLFLSAYANCNLAFLFCFWSNGFLSLSGLSSHVGLISLDNDTYLKASAASPHLQDVLFLFWDNCAHLAPEHVHLCDPELLWVGWWLDIPLVFILAFNRLNRWICHLPASENCTQGYTRLLLPISWLISFDFPMLSYVEKMCLRCASKYIHACSSN